MIFTVLGMSLFIAHQHAEHAEQNIVLADLSVRHTLLLYLNKCTYCQTRDMILVF